MTDPNRPDQPLDNDPLRPHVYDGIQEYDKHLPNWWLYTLYGSIAFAFVYWFYYYTTRVGPDDHTAINAEMARIKAVQLASMDVSKLDNDAIWAMSQNPAFVDAGKATFIANCVSCHGANLTGGIGVNLVDATWVHGGEPLNVLKTVSNGVQAKGMPNWGPVLGPKKTVEVVAFVLSHHKKP